LELLKEFELRQKTCWQFKWKIQQAMQYSKQYSLKGEMYVSEFFIGGPKIKREDLVKGKSGWWYLH